MKVVSEERNYAVDVRFTIMAGELGYGPLGKGHYILHDLRVGFKASIRFDHGVVTFNPIFFVG